MILKDEEAALVSGVVEKVCTWRAGELVAGRLARPDVADSYARFCSIELAKLWCLVERLASNKSMAALRAGC
jgi:hypothetical protein